MILIKLYIESNEKFDKNIHQNHISAKIGMSN